ncbi:MAG: TetR/AcrR family transcriptional regulator [Vicinamibacterales bacterium]
MQHDRVSARRRPEQPARPPDPCAVLTASRTLFLRHGYAGTTMEDVAAEAGLTKRTLYSNYGDKDTLFRQMVDDTVAYAASFARELHDEFASGLTHATLAARLDALGVRLALGILRPEVVALRRMLIGASRDFPRSVASISGRAPDRCCARSPTGSARSRSGDFLRARDPQRAAAQFAYLVAGEHLDFALMTGELPAREVVEATAREGVATFLARYAPPG